MAEFADPLMRVPGLAGYLAAGQRREQQAAMEQQKQKRALDIEGVLRARQEEQQLQGILAQAGGDPEASITALLRAGTPASVALAQRIGQVGEAQAKAAAARNTAAMVSGATPAQMQDPEYLDRLG